MGNRQDDRGTDFFDFFVEVWHRKFVVAGIIVGAGAFSWLLREYDQPPPPAPVELGPTTYTGRIEFFIADTDPLGRGAVTLNADIVARFARGMGAEAEPKRDGLSQGAAIHYTWGLDYMANLGHIAMVSGDRAIIDRAFATVEDAARQQAEASLAEVRRRKAVTEAAIERTGSGTHGLYGALLGYELALDVAATPVGIYKKLVVEQRPAPPAVAPQRSRWSVTVGLLVGLLLAGMYVSVDVARRARSMRTTA